MNGCHNRSEFAEGYWAPERFYFPDGRFEIRNKWIPNRMSRECQFTIHTPDPSCNGCKHTEQK